MSFVQVIIQLKKNKQTNFAEGALFVICTFLPITQFWRKTKTTWFEKPIKPHEKWTIGTNEPENDQSKLLSKYST